MLGKLEPVPLCLTQSHKPINHLMWWSNLIESSDQMCADSGLDGVTLKLESQLQVWVALASKEERNKNVHCDRKQRLCSVESEALAKVTLLCATLWVVWKKVRFITEFF